MLGRRSSDHAIGCARKLPLVVRTENLRMTSVTRGTLILQGWWAKWSAWLRVLIRVLLSLRWLWRVGERGMRALAHRVWSVVVLRRRSRRVGRRILLESRRPSTLRQVGRERLLGDAMARRPASGRSRGMCRVRRILLAGVRGHRALRWILRKGILARGVMRRRLQWSRTLAMEVQRASR